MTRTDLPAIIATYRAIKATLPLNAAAMESLRPDPEVVVKHNMAKCALAGMARGFLEAFVLASSYAEIDNWTPDWHKPGCVDFDATYAAIRQMADHVAIRCAEQIMEGIEGRNIIPSYKAGEDWGFDFPVILSDKGKAARHAHDEYVADAV